MRRKDKEITDNTLTMAVLEKATTGHIALADGTNPYCIPINFAYHNGYIYFHSATKGKKLDIIEKNNKICFQTELLAVPIKGDDPCDFGMKFTSINCTGTAEILDTPEEKKEALKIITEKYAGNGYPDFNAKMVEAVSCIRLRLTNVSGKLSGYSPEEALDKINRRVY